jgi:DNA polymerase
LSWKEELQKFYEKRKDFIQSHIKENIDFTEVKDEIEKKSTAPIMIIGEAPGEREVKLKTPFVGKAGENLNFLISLSPYSRDDFLITNAFPFRTFQGNKNRTPKASELKLGAKLLEEEIKIVKPKMILLLGNSSIKAFSYIVPEVKNLKKCGIYDINTKLGKLKIGVCFHPSPLAFNRKEIKNSLIEFFKNLKA